MRPAARARLVAALAAAVGAAACQTVDLGDPPADVNACRPSQSYFVKVWDDVLDKDYGGKKCSDATCHDPATGRPLSLVAAPLPAIDHAMPPVPLPGDWAANYLSASEQMSCSDVEASDLVIYPTATRPHGGGALFGLTSPEAQEIELWVTAP